MHLSPLIAMDLLGWSLPAWSQLLHFFRIACRCQQCHGPAGADGLGHRRREQRSSLCWLTEASLGAYLGMFGHLQVSVPTGINWGRDKGAPRPHIWTELFRSRVSL